MSKNSDVNPKKKNTADEDVMNASAENMEEVNKTDTPADLEEQDAGNALNELLEKKEAEVKEMTDRMQRLAAEFDNFRKRTQKEKERIYVDAVSDVVGSFLPVVDNLERAIKAAEQEESQGLKEGVNLVFRQIMDVLNKLEIKPIETVGSCFDPEIHNAVMHIEDDSMDCNVIVEEFQRGYIYKDEIVIRHSVVKVAN